MKAESDLYNSRTVVEADLPVTWFYPDSLDTVILYILQTAASCHVATQNFRNTYLDLGC